MRGYKRDIAICLSGYTTHLAALCLYLGLYSHGIEFLLGGAVAPDLDLFESLLKLARHILRVQEHSISYHRISLDWTVFLAS